MARRTAPPRPPAGPPASAEAGAALVDAHMLKLFARHDGEAVDRRMMAETLLRAGRDALARLPDDARMSLAGEAHAWLYEAMTADPGASHSKAGGPGSAPSNTEVFKAVAPGLSK